MQIFQAARDVKAAHVTSKPAANWSLHDDGSGARTRDQRITRAPDLGSWFRGRSTGITVDWCKPELVQEDWSTGEPIDPLVSSVVRRASAVVP